MTIFYKFKRANVQWISDALKDVVRISLLQLKASEFPPWYNSELKECTFEKKNTVKYFHNKTKRYVTNLPSTEVIVYFSRLRVLHSLFDPSFANHVSYVVNNKAKKKLEFNSRSTSDFTRPSSIITLFKSLILPIHSYAAQIWSLSTNYEKFELAKVHSGLEVFSFQI